MTLGALDIDITDHGIAAILPDSVTPETLTAQFDPASLTVSAAIGRDDASVWMLSPRPGALRLTDSDAFGTGYHPTTALCIEALEEILRIDQPECILDVGTGTGILALTALTSGVPRATGVDTDPTALEAAKENAQLNQLSDRLELVLGGPEKLDGRWPLVIANILTAPLIEIAPALINRLAINGQLILSGIHESLVAEVRRAYQYFGINLIDAKTRGGWTILSNRPRR